MEKQIQIYTKGYSERLLRVGIGLILMWGCVTTVVNFTWNLRVIYGIDKVSLGRLLLVYFMLAVSIYLTYMVLDFILLRTLNVLISQKWEEVYRLTFQQSSLYMFLPCINQGISIYYNNIKSWGIQRSQFTRGSITFFINLKEPVRGRMEYYVYVRTKDIRSIAEACKVYAPELPFKKKSESMASFILTVLTATNCSLDDERSSASKTL